MSEAESNPPPGLFFPAIAAIICCIWAEVGMMGAGIPRDWAFSWKDVEVAMMTSIKFSAFGSLKVEGGAFETWSSLTLLSYIRGAEQVEVTYVEGGAESRVASYAHWEQRQAGIGR